MNAVMWDQMPGVGKAIYSLIVFGFVMGMAWVTATMTVAGKADRNEVQQLQSELQGINRELRTIRLMLCDGKPADSYCRINP